MEIMKKRKAFTLAEVLITLSIIGVVAALTIPSLVTNYKSKALETQSNKAKAVLANGFKLMMANDDVGSIEDTTFAACNGNSTCYADEMNKIFNVTSEYFPSGGETKREAFREIAYAASVGTKAAAVSPAPAVGAIASHDKISSDFTKEYKFPESDSSNSVWTNSAFNYSFVTSDNMIFGIKTLTDRNGEVNVIVVTDVNGPKKPNKGTEDLRKYVIKNNGTLVDKTSDMASWNPNNNFEPSVCSSSDLSACTNQSDCENAGGSWDGLGCRLGHLIDDLCRDCIK